MNISETADSAITISADTRSWGRGGNKIMLNKAPSQWWQIESDWSDAKKLHLNAETTGQNSDDSSLNALTFLVLPPTDAPPEAIHVQES